MTAVRLTLDGPERFLVGGRPAPTADLAAPGGVIGRSVEADLPIAETPTTVAVSRRHVMLERLATGWVARDCGSANGTVLESGPGRRVVMRPGFALPLATGARLTLAGVLTVRVTLEAAEPAGARTVASPNPLDLHAAGALEGRLLRVAELLTAPRRITPGTHAVTRIDELAEQLHVARGTVYNDLRALARLAPVALRVERRPGDDLAVPLADALIAAFPELGDPGYRGAGA